MQIDLNSDLGESFGEYRLGADEAVLESVTSANIACGYHAGDPGVMRKTVRLARDAGVSVGAHPGFPDLMGFGRREMRMSAEDVENMVIYQIGALAAVAAAEGVRLAHVKPHGALYNMAVHDRGISDAIARGVRAVDQALILFGLPESELARAAARVGVAFAAEGFADRAYEPDGTLTPRSRAGSVVHDPDAVVRRAVQLATEGRVTAMDGSQIAVRIDTLCLHGDTAGAPELTRLIRRALEQHGVVVRAIRAAAPRG